MTFINVINFHIIQMVGLHLYRYFVPMFILKDKLFDVLKYEGFVAVLGAPA